MSDTVDHWAEFFRNDAEDALRRVQAGTFDLSNRSMGTPAQQFGPITTALTALQGATTQNMANQYYLKPGVQITTDTGETVDERLKRIEEKLEMILDILGREMAGKKIEVDP